MLKQLGARLEKVVSLIEPGLPVWDLCCDHGYVGTRALENNLSPEVHFVDAVPEIVGALEKKLSDFGEFLGAPRVEFHKLKAEDLSWENISGNLIITGVGVDTIIAILEAIPDSRLLYCRMILGPQNRQERLHSYILARGMPFELCHEWVVREGRRYRHLFLVNSVPLVDDNFLKRLDATHGQKVWYPSLEP